MDIGLLPSSPEIHCGEPHLARQGKSGDGSILTKASKLRLHGNRLCYCSYSSG